MNFHCQNCDRIYNSGYRAVTSGENLEHKTVANRFCNAPECIAAEMKACGVRDPSKPECEGDEDHSIAKLGHAANCHYFGFNVPALPTLDHDPCVLSRTDAHDFSWASYNDDTVSTGVCRCGLREIDRDMAVMP